MVFVIIDNNNNTFEPGSQSPASAMSAMHNAMMFASLYFDKKFKRNEARRARHACQGKEKGR